MPSPNLNITHLTASQYQKEVTTNAAIDALDNAMNSQLSVNVSAGNGTVSVAQMRAAYRVLAVSGATARDITFAVGTGPKRAMVIAVAASCSDPVTFIKGTTEIELQPEEARLVYFDGTADGMEAIAGGGGGGLSDAPSDGTAYGRKDATWVEVLEDAPSDGDEYVRKDGDWEVATGGGGGGGTYIVANPGEYAPPDAADFSISLDPGAVSPTFTNQDVGAVFNAKAYIASGRRVTGVLKAVPVATPYTITTRLKLSALGENFCGGGLILRNSSNGRFWTLKTASTTGQKHEFENWASATSNNASLFNRLRQEHTDWMRMVNNGTSISCYVSADGQTWTLIGSQNIATYVGTPDQVGFWVEGLVTGPPTGEPGLLVTYYEDDDYPANTPGDVVQAALLYGSGAPDDGADGYDGDSYIDTTNSVLYGPKAAGAWPDERRLLSKPCTPPLVAGFTWVNQAGASATDTARGLVFSKPSGTTDDISALVKVMPATPYTIVMELEWLTSGDPNAFGIFIGDSSGGRYVGFGIETLVTTRLLNALGQKWTSATAFSANYQVMTLSGDHPKWLKVEDNGTNFIFSVSRDGDNWAPVQTVSRTDFIVTPDRIGFGGWFDGAGADALANNILVIRRFEVS